MGLGHPRSVSAHANGSFELTADCGRVPSDLAGDRPDAQATGLQPHDLLAFFKPEIAISGGLGRRGGIHAAKSDEDPPTPTPRRAGCSCRLVDTQASSHALPKPPLVLTRQIG